MTFLTDRASAFVAFVVAVLSILACSERHPTSSPAAGGAAGAAPAAPTLRFDVEGGDEDMPTLELAAEQDVALKVIVTPPDVYRVRFSILDLSANVAPVDASLNQTDVDTNEDGEATIELHAPSMQSTFELRASIGTVASTSLEVRVREKIYAELQVIPDYDGRRPVEEWFAVAYPSQLCEHITRPMTLEDIACDDQPDQSESGPRTPCGTGEPVVFLDVWSGPSYAVTMGAGNYIHGCKQVFEIAAYELTDVTVSVSNIPIYLADESLMTVMGIFETSDPWVQHLNGSIDSAMQAFTGETDNDLALILDTMAEHIDNDVDRAGFQERRLENNWEYLALSSLASQDGLLLRNRLRSWMVAGADQLQSDDALIGRIDPTDDGFEFAITEIAGIDAESAGFEPPAGNPTTWTAEADDTVVLATALSWAPSKLVVALGAAEALSEYPAEPDLQGALGELIDCNVLAQTLIDSNDVGIIPQCPVWCGAQLCNDALETLVGRAQEALLEPQVLELNAAGVAVVDERARPASFEGTWLGSFPGGVRAISGSIDGEATGPLD